ncbi:MAG TPA: DUF2079 domain-containing protein [Vicinamibacterales bacterium]|nr:DUF2079 domain-containing protein [Vicinamibacterales bacterium]
MTARASHWAAVALTLAVIAISTHQTLTRYREFRSGFSWDLAYYNQWFWAVTRGDRVITVRPLAAYAQEGPSVWKMNYLAPIRFALVPIYGLFPDPRTLLVIQNAIFWCVVAAAYTLVRSESQSEGIALSAALLTVLTPLFWPLAWNDFRELQLGVPFVLWGIQGWRTRKHGLATFGIAGMLACRQEYGLLVALFALVPPRHPDAPGRRQAWIWSALIVGVGWFALVFLAYLSRQVGSHAPAEYLVQLTGTRAPIGETVASVLEFLFIGLGSFAVLALFAPRIALVAAPLVWSLCSGQWGFRTMETVHWHHVRYAAPVTALLVAAGLIGYARASGLLSTRFQSRWVLVSFSAFVAVGLVASNVVLQHRFARVPRPITESEADRLWVWIHEVAPDDGVLAAYEVAAPLSSRRLLYSYRLDENKPAGYPRLAPEIRWAFVREGEVPPQLFTYQGFIDMDAGPAIRVFRRNGDQSIGSPP